MSEPFLGTVMIWAPNFAPRGWAFCQGQTLSLNTNTALFALLGTTYGGNGQTTFGLPNLQGRIPVGQGQNGNSSYNLGDTAGAETVTLTAAQMPAHNHQAVFTPSPPPSVQVTLNATENAATSDKPLADNQLGDLFPNTAKLYAPQGGTQVPLVGASATLSGPQQGTVVIDVNGSSAPFSVLQPYQVLNYVIALEGIFPSRP